MSQEELAAKLGCHFTTVTVPANATSVTLHDPTGAAPDLARVVSP